MSIRFKFRSAVNFDTIAIDDGKPYISVGELRSKILRQKKLTGICHKDFDLVFFDHLTGQEYADDEFKISSGSSVIIKRVPAEPVPSSMLKPHKLEASELSVDIPKANAGMDNNKPVEIVLEKKMALKDHEHIKLETVANGKSIDLEKVDLPSELRCPICNAYFKEAVMIPCCQHSFCKKCIIEVLPLTARCPKCSSTKYRVEHLLPNLSLRHAIEHFLESQILATAPENDLQKYVPDGESGIQGKEVSTITKRKLDLLYSTSVMKKGSNQNMAESTGFHTGKSSAIDLNSTHLLKVTNINGVEDKHENLAPCVDSQGENQPVMAQVCKPDEADFSSRKRGPWVNSGGGDRGYAMVNRNKEVGRTCYRCGSPSHFIRNCPMASADHPMFHTGYAMPYWNHNAFPTVNPYMNMYGNPGMMPFNSSMVPVTPYGVQPYVPSMYGSLPVPSTMNNLARMGGLTPVGPRAEPLRHSENLELQNSDNRIRYSYEKRQRSSDYEDNDYHNLERTSEYKSHREIRGKALSNSEESHGQKLQKHHKRSRRDHGSDRSVSGVDDVHSGNYDRYDDEVRHKKYHRRHHNNNSSSREQQSDSDCSCTRHQIKKEKDVKRKETRDTDDYYHHNKRKRVH